MKHFLVASLALLMLLLPGHEEEPNHLTPVLERIQDRTAEEVRSRVHRRIQRWARQFGIHMNLSRLVYREARRTGVPPEIAYRLVHRESGFDARAVSRVGAIGLTQILPGPSGPYPLMDRQELFERDANLRLGFRYLRDLYDRWGSWRLALISYHRGPTRTHRELRRGSDHGRSEVYAADILR